jgi:hypothetical protein|tara:strand:+ start:1030 stop:1320 length:291 start_codon:yes stop_codon:yes gene_type:complete
MSNYDMDEIERQREREKRSRGIRPEIGKDEEPWVSVGIEVKDEDFLKIAQEAHARDITFNKMINIILKTGIKDAEYKFEHDSQPQLLNEIGEPFKS